MNKILEVREQIQEDIRTYMDFMEDEVVVDQLCEIVVQNFATLLKVGNQTD